MLIKRLNLFILSRGAVDMITECKELYNILTTITGGIWANCQLLLIIIIIR